MKIYLDACFLSRLTEDQSQARVREEAEAVEHVLRMIWAGVAVWVSRTVLTIEISRNPDSNRRHDAEQLLSFADETVVPTSADAERARHIEEFGFGAFDALRLASAERGGLSVFLTTDDDLLRRARRNPGQLNIRVENPVTWYEEVRS